MINFLLAGTLSSIIHVISGPDHLAAVTPLAIETKERGWRIGFFWGLGHLIGMLSIGVLFLLFQQWIPIDGISAYSEQLVAIILISIGIWSFYRIFKEQKIVNSPHIHSGEVHIHKHPCEHQHHHKKVVRQNLFSALGIGFIHGLAGVSHFFLLLPTLSFEHQIDSIEYILGFAIGTVLAMTTYAFILNKIALYSRQEHQELFFKGIRFAGGLFALVIGIYWLILTF